jgi:large repetitive protein
MQRLLLGACALVLAAAGLVSTPLAAQAALAAPSSLSPADEPVSGTPVLEWTREAGADQYEVQVSSDPSFATTLYTVKTSNRRAVPTSVLPSGDVYWRVRGVTSSDSSAWTSTSFTSDPRGGPSLLAPANDPQSENSLGQPNQPPLLAWEPVAGATGYEVSTSYDQNFVTDVKTYATKTTSYLVDLPTPGVPVYWEVKAVLGSGLFSNPSERWTFTVKGFEEPDVVSPAMDEQVDDVVLDWEPVPGAKDYEVRVSTDQDFNTIIDGRVVVGTRYSPPMTYNNDEYWWQVRPRNVDGYAMAWSEVTKHPFQRRWPDLVQLEHPANTFDQIGDPFFYQWQPIPHASEYELQVGSDEAFSPTTFDTCFTKATTYTPQASGPTGTATGCMPHAGVSYWRVRAVDEPRTPDVRSEWSLTRHFYYVPDLVTQISPADQASAVDVPTLTWEPAQNAVKYIVKLSWSGGSTTATTYSTSWTPTVRLDPAKGPFTWTVQAVDNANRSTPAPLAGWTFDLSDAASASVNPLRPLGPTPDQPSRRFPSLTWEPLEAADHYKVHVAKPQTSLYTTLSEKFYFPAATDVTNRFLAPGQYSWFITANDAAGNVLATGAPGTFTISDLDTPAGQNIALTGEALGDPATSCDRFLDDTSGAAQKCEGLRQTPVLSWDPVEDAGLYLIYLARDRELTNPVYTPYVTTWNTRWTPTQQLPDSQAGTAYYWAVVPCKTPTTCSVVPRLATHAFDKQSEPVELVAPQFGTTLPDEITFDWRRALDTNQDAMQLDSSGIPATVEARQYRIQVATEPSFKTTLISELVDQTTYTPYSKTLPEGTLYWRVQVIDGSGNALPWSDTWTLRKESPRPEPTGPAHEGITTTTPFLTWGPQDFAAGYQVEIYKNADDTHSSTNRVLLSPSTTDQAAYTGITQLAPDMSYLWRVRRKDASNLYGPWSSDQVFTVRSAPPQLVAPTELSAVPAKDALFAWEATAGASRYKFERRKAGSTFSSETVTTSALAWAPTAVLSDGAWEWRVSSLDASNRVMAQSPWRPVLVDSVLPTLTDRLPGSSVRPDSNWVVSFSEPVQGVDNTSMQLFQAGAADPVTATVTSGDGGRVWTLDPTSLMTANVKYTLRLSDSITDRGGNRITPISYSRTIVLDTTRPRVVKKAPGTRTTPGANWIVTFSEPVVKVSGTTMKLYRAGRTRPVVGRITKSNSGRTWTLNPSSSMARRVRYTLKLTSGISDRTGNRLRAMSYSSTVR